MRKDAKAGMALALIIVVVAGWYYTRDDTDRGTITLAPQNENTPPEQDDADLALPVQAPAPTVPLTAERIQQEADAVQPGGIDEDVDEVSDETDDGALTAPGPHTARPRALAATLEPIEFYIIQPGDTFAALAEIYYGNRELATLIQRANPQVRDPDQPTVGAEIRLPAVPAEQPQPHVATIAPTRSPEAALPKPAAATAERAYTVRSGDSFYAIAQRVLGDGSRWPELLEINKELVGGDPQRLRPGMTLRLPAE